MRQSTVFNMLRSIRFFKYLYPCTGGQGLQSRDTKYTCTYTHAHARTHTGITCTANASSCGTRTSGTPQLRARVRTHSRYNFDHTLVVTLCQYKSRYKLYIQQRNKLSNQLFLAKDSFCEPLLDLKKETLEVQNVALLGRLWSA